jgi:hypothetical protein
VPITVDHSCHVGHWQRQRQKELLCHQVVAEFIDVSNHLGQSRALQLETWRRWLGALPSRTRPLSWPPMLRHKDSMFLALKLAGST